MLTPLLQNLRNEYKQHSLDETTVSANPFHQFQQWFAEVVEAEISEANAMTLATATPEGKPSARIVLLKGMDDTGFVFYTNYESRKGAELAANPQGALLFFWKEIERQIRIEGSIEKVSREESAEYFQSRPEGSRLGAWASHQSTVLANRAAIEEQYAQIAAQYADGNIPLPDYWGGYRLLPHYFEFWQGRSNRLHDRVQYDLTEKGWTISRLSP